MKLYGAIIKENRGEFLTGLAILCVLYLTSFESFLLFHSVIELFTVVVAAGIFVIAWNARNFINNNYLVFVGIASIFTAILDLFHTLAYQGMGVFEAGSGDLTTNLWVSARFLQSLSFLIAPVFLSRRLRVHAVMAVFTVVTAVLILTIFYWNVFPTTYVAGVGLTRFKVVSEYVISFFLLAAIVQLIRIRGEFDPSVLRFLVAALVFLIASEITFTFYLSVYGEVNVLGHMLRLVAFYALYKAFIVTGLENPYALLLRDLKRTQERLQEYTATLESRNETLRLTERQLRRDAVLLEERNVELDAYAHTVAHDLKAPLSVIIAASEMVRGIDYLTDETKERLLEDIQTTAVHMDEIVDDLLLLSQVRQEDAPTGPVDMDAVIANVRNRLSEMIREREAILTYPDTWPIPVGYGPWIEEVWANYVSNALKYGGRPPRVELGATREGDDQIRFWVRDNGPGVDPGARSRLFVPFSQLGEVHRAGHGLGLSIVHHVVRKLGGRVGVESAPDQGSLFFFTLPAASRHSPGSDSSEAAPSLLEHRGR